MYYSVVQVVFFTSSPSNFVSKVRVQVLGLEVKLKSNPNTWTCFLDLNLVQFQFLRKITAKNVSNASNFLIVYNITYNRL